MLPVLQDKLALELEPSQGGLQPLTGRWWRKRWSKDKATGAMDQLLKLLEVRAVAAPCPSAPSQLVVLPA